MRPRWRGCCATIASMLVVNCLGVLQDGPGSDTAGCEDRHFVARLLQAIRESNRAIRLVHLNSRQARPTEPVKQQQLLANMSGVGSIIGGLQCY